MGIGILLKSIIPLSLYGVELLAAVLGLAGNPRWPIYMLVFILPLRNINEKLYGLPGGTQMINVLLVSAIIGWFVSAQSKKKAFFGSSGVTVVAILMIVYIFFSVLIGSNYLYGSFSFATWDHRLADWKNISMMPIIFFIIFNTIESKSDALKVVAVMCAAIFVVNYYTISQASWYSSLASRSKITATFQFLGPNEVAAFLNEYAIILLSLFFAMRKSWSKWGLLLLLMMCFYSIIFCYSRGAYVGLLLGFFILFAVKRPFFLVPLIACLLLWQVVLPQKVIDRIKETKTETGELDESSANRILIWGEAMRLFESSPMTGIGFGVFRYLGLVLGDTHNIYFKILAEQGLIGFILFLSVVFAFMREGFLCYKKGEDDECRALGLGLLACMFVLLVNNLFGDRWSYLEPNAYLWVFAALAARLGRMKDMPSISKDVPKEEKPQGLMTPQEFPKKRKKLRYYDL